MEVYDQAFMASDQVFVGPLAEPRPPALRIVLHEVGHAVARARGFETGLEFRQHARVLQGLADQLTRLGARVTQPELEFLEGIQERIAKLADGVRRANPAVARARRESAELQAFRAASGRGVTVYGRTSLGEAHAEAFALALTDPEALRRADEAALAFFRSERRAP